MFVVRPLESRDIPALAAFATSVGIGVTSLSKDRKILEDKLQRSVQSFQKKIHPEQAVYFFVLEELASHEIRGCSSLVAQSKGIERGWAFHLEPMNSLKEMNEEPDGLLKPKLHPKGGTELGGLYLLPDHRGRGLGKILSLARLLFVAQNLQLFPQDFFAELRGVTDSKGDSPFWKGIGEHFLHIDYETLLRLSAQDSTSIPLSIPPYPIYLPLLSEEVKKSVGVAHQNTKAAQKLLLEEGFHYEGEVSLFDGGPKLRCKRDMIRTVQKNILTTIQKVRSVEQKNSAILAREAPPFRAIRHYLELHDNGTISIDPIAASALAVEEGDQVRAIFI